MHLRTRLERLCVAVALAWSFIAVPAAKAVLADVAGRGTAYSSLPLWSPGNWDIAMLIDGDRAGAFHLDVAPEPGAEYTVDLGAAYSIHTLRLYPRQDGCCPERFSDIRISVHGDSDGAPGAELWGTDLFTDGSNPGSGSGIVVEVPLPAPVTGQWVRIRSIAETPVDYALQLTDLEIIADVPESEVNRARNTLVTANQPLFGNADPALLVNGNRGREQVHGVELIEPGFAYTINLGSTVNLSRIVIWPRQDYCCPERLSSYRVSVHGSENGAIGDAVWSADRFVDGDNPGSHPGAKDVLTADLDPGGQFRGQWIRIESLEDPVTSYALQIAEVEAFGETEGGPVLLITSHPADATGGVGQDVTFSVGANAPGGDASQITYQWRRNGTPIEGATNATLTVSAKLSDDKATFDCVVSYEGLPSQTSDAATLRVNLAYQARAFSNQPLYAGWSISILVNGARNDVVHGDTEIETGFAYDVDLGAEVEIERVDLYPRQDGCCPERLQNFRVSIHDDANGQPGEEVWGVDLYTDGTNPGATAGTVVPLTGDLDPQGEFTGRWIRILALDDPVNNYHLQMSELEVFGTYTVSTPTIEIQSQPADYGTVPGRRAVFSISARVINGDPDQLTYQWTRNGTPIPGATEATYTTPPLTSSDEGATFRCVVSYPGATDVTSEPAEVSFDGNYAKGQPAYSNQRLWGALVIDALVNGNRNDFVHGDTQIAPGFAYEVDLGADVTVTRIEIYPRQDGCCAERFTNLRVQLLEDNNGQPGTETWHADIFTDGSNPGSGPGLVVTLTASDGEGQFRGSWLRLLSLDEPPGDYALQFAEVEVYGTAEVSVPFSVSARRGNNGVEIEWSEGVLESAADLGGPWEPVTGATSPHVVTPDADHRFYRARR